METMRTEAVVDKYVIIAMRDGRLKYVGRRYKPYEDEGYTVKVNEAMVCDTEQDAQKVMEEFGIKGHIGKIRKHTELVEVM